MYLPLSYLFPGQPLRASLAHDRDAVCIYEVPPRTAETKVLSCLGDVSRMALLAAEAPGISLGERLRVQKRAVEAAIWPYLLRKDALDWAALRTVEVDGWDADGRPL